MNKSSIFSIFTALFLIVLAIIIAYSNSLSGPFLFDDYHNIIGNEYIKISDVSVASLKQAAVEEPSKYRWIPKISFALNYYFAEKKSRTTGYHAGTGLNGNDFDEPSSFGYHLVNLFIHIAAALSLFFLFRLTLGSRQLGEKSKYATEIAFAAALLWALHPLQTNAVTYIVQRMTSMASLFVLCSLLFYIVARRQGKSLFYKGAFFCISLGCGFLAMFSKENGAILPLLLIGYEFYFSDSKRLPSQLKTNCIIFGMALLLLVGLGWLYMGSNPFAGALHGYGSRDFTLIERLLTQPRVIVHYLSLLLLPFPSRLNLAYDFPVSTSLVMPLPTLFALLVIVALVFFMFFLFKRDRLLSFGLFWFLANLAIESSVIPLEIIFEHRVYLLAVFLMLALVYRSYGWGQHRIWLTRVLLTGLVLLLMFFTWQRNDTFASRENVWADVALKSPGLTRGHMGLYMAYNAQGREDEAIQSLKKAIEVGPDEFRPSYNLANFYKEKKQYKQALGVLNGMLKRKELGTAPAYHLRASIYFDLRNYQAALADALKAIEVDPKHLDSLLVLGSSYFRLNNFSQAAKYFKEAQKQEPNTYAIYFNLGTTYYNMGEYDKAILNYRTALDFMPNNADIHYNLGLVYGAKGMVREMQEEIAISRRLKGQGK